MPSIKPSIVRFFPPVTPHKLLISISAPRWRSVSPAVQRTRSQQRRWATTAPNPHPIVHQHLRGDEHSGIVQYEVAEAFQDQARSEFLAWKALPDQAKAAVEPPRPLLISFESAPTFTLGRRQDDLTLEQATRLEQPLQVDLARRRVPIKETYQPQVRRTSRGGLTTYHGPGQLVLWPVIDMHSPLYAHFGVASYAAHLEATTRQFLADAFGIKSYSILDEPGVWADSSPGGPPRKIAAMGVHHRRYVTALGIAINIDVPVTGPEALNPWARFIPCGLEGKLVTSVANEVGPGNAEVGDLAGLAKQWAAIFSKGLTDKKEQ